MCLLKCVYVVAKIYIQKVFFCIMNVLIFWTDIMLLVILQCFDVGWATGRASDL